VRNNKQDGGEQQPKMMENKSLYQGEHESIRRGRTTWMVENNNLKTRETTAA
jgi:hypothetical protein